MGTYKDNSVRECYFCSEGVKMRKDKLQQLKKRSDPEYRRIIDNLKIMGVYDEFTGRTYTLDEVMNDDENKLSLFRKKMGAKECN